MDFPKVSDYPLCNFCKHRHRGACWCGCQMSIH